ncbi:MAG: hypothetical protein QM632_03515 [Micrococcaceae bacterium]
MSIFTLALADTAQEAGLPHWAVGATMFTTLMTLCLITLSYTNVYNKHGDPEPEENDAISSLVKNDASH